MALKPKTRKYTFTSGGGDLLATILDLPQNTWLGSVTIRASRNNSADVFWSDENGQQGGFIGAGEAAVFNYGVGQSLIGLFRIFGTNGDIIYMTVGVNAP